MDSVKMITMRILLMALLVAVVGTPASAELSTPVAQRIIVAAQNVDTLRSDFTQEKYLSMFDEKLVSSGQFFYQHPDMLRWELLSPISSGFVLHGDSGRRWHQSIDGSETFKLDQDKAMALIAEQLFAWAKADIDWLQANYSISVVQEEPIQLRLEPPPATAGFLRFLLITFAADASYVASVEIHENDGDYTRINFNNTQVNTQINKSMFYERLSQ